MIWEDGAINVLMDMLLLFITLNLHEKQKNPFRIKTGFHFRLSKLVKKKKKGALPPAEVHTLEKNNELHDSLPQRKKWILYPQHYCPDTSLQPQRGLFRTLQMLDEPFQKVQRQHKAPASVLSLATWRESVSLMPPQTYEEMRRVYTGVCVRHQSLFMSGLLPEVTWRLCYNN